MKIKSLSSEQLNVRIEVEDIRSPFPKPGLLIHARERQQMNTWKVAAAVFLGITIAVFVFSPDMLPRRVGIRFLPVEVGTHTSLLGPITGKVAVLTNNSGKTLYNVRVVCRNENLDQEKVYDYEEWAPYETKRIGWMEGWSFLTGESLTVTASGYFGRLKVVWD